MRRVLAAIVGLLLAGGISLAAGDPLVGRKIGDWTARDYRGAERNASEYSEKKLVVVAFLGCECPLAKLYGPRLAALAKSYENKGVAFIGVNANHQDSPQEIAQYAKDAGLDIAILKDAKGELADRFGAERTPEVFLLDASRTVVYHGRVDDQYGIGYQRPSPTRHELKEAIEAQLAGKPIPVSFTSVVGCRIGRPLPATNPGSTTVTYSKHIARIFQKRCVECHRAGEIGPFPMERYDDLVGWTATIREVITQRRMPPWHADPTFGHFSNDARLSDEEIAQVLAWIDAGAPEGDKRDLPPALVFETGWRIPKPDVVVEMPTPYVVPASGTVPYKYFVVDPGFKEDKWIRAAECIPGNRAVVHHIIIAVVPPDVPGQPGRQELGDWLTATAPGARPLLLPDGYAKKIPAGSKILFQMHYTPNGVQQSDKSKVGFVFTDPKTVRHLVVTDKASTHRLRIPPNEANYTVEATKRIQQDTLMLAMFPHMHLRGKAFRYDVTYPNGSAETLLNVPRYDFAWQNAYIFETPKRLPKGTVLKCTAVYDNSTGNLSNPNPNTYVTWGDQTWEEMMIGYYDAVDADFRPTQPKKLRSADFRAKYSDGAVAMAPETKQVLSKALQSPQDFEKAYQSLRNLAPQIDRLCLTTMTDNSLKIEFCAQERALQRSTPAAGFERNALGYTLAEYIRSAKLTVVDDLGKAKGMDLRAMSRFLRSSLHVPIHYKGKSASLNLWSTEADAFPPNLVAAIRTATETLTEKSAK